MLIQVEGTGWRGSVKEHWIPVIQGECNKPSGRPSCSDAIRFSASQSYWYSTFSWVSVTVMLNFTTYQHPSYGASSEPWWPTWLEWGRPRLLKCTCGCVCEGVYRDAQCIQQQKEGRDSECRQHQLLKRLRRVQKKEEASHLFWCKARYCCCYHLWTPDCSLFSL